MKSFSFIIIFCIVYFLPNKLHASDYYDCVAKQVYRDCSGVNLHPYTNCSKLPDNKLHCSEKIDLNEQEIRRTIQAEIENDPGTVYAARPFLVCSDELQLKRRGEIFKWKSVPVVCPSVTINQQHSGSGDNVAGDKIML